EALELAVGHPGPVTNREPVRHRPSGAATAADRAAEEIVRDLLRALALLDRRVVHVPGAGVDLARAGDLLLGVLDHLEPLRDPAGRPRDREDHREHLR